MLDIAAIKGVVDLIKELIDLTYLKNQHRRDMFDKTCKPIYEKMESITKDYHAMLYKVASDLTADNVADVLKNLKSERANFIIARDGIYGAANALRRHCERHHPTKLAERSFLSLATKFADGVLSQFDKSYDTLESDVTSMGGGLIVILSHVKDIDESKRPILGYYLNEDGSANIEVVRKDVISDVKKLEEKWKEVSRRYAELKLFCDA